MHDIEDILTNIESIYDSNTAFNVLKDFERVLDSLDLYVYDNWSDGELSSGPNIERHWVSCAFMWDRNNMPDPMGAKRLLDYDCKVSYEKTHLIVPKKIKNPDDMRPMSKKGKLERKPIWIVNIQMPKRLIADIYSGYYEDVYIEPTQTPETNPEPQAADMAAAAPEAEAAL
jgi:hypothetical protein